MVRAGEDDALDAVAARRLVEVVAADDVGLQDGVERPLGRDAAEVHDRVDAREQRVDGGRVLERRDGTTSSPSPAAPRSATSLSAQHAAVRAQARRAARGRGRRRRRSAAGGRSAARRGGGGRHAGVGCRQCGELVATSIVSDKHSCVSDCQPSYKPTLTPGEIPESPLAPDVRAAVQRPRNLALALVESLGDRIRDGRLAPGDKLPTEAAIMAEFGVSRTVVREAMSKLQAAGAGADAPRRRHLRRSGCGDSAVFRIRADQLETLHDVVAMLELRIGVETEAAGAGRAAPQRRRTWRRCGGRSTRSRRRCEAGATQWALTSGSISRSPARRRTRTSRPVESLGAGDHPARPARPGRRVGRRAARRTCAASTASTSSILDAIANRDTEAARAAMRTHLANSRERRRAVDGGLASRPRRLTTNNCTQREQHVPPTQPGIDAAPTMQNTRRLLLTLAGLAVLPFAALAAYPEKPVTLVVPFPPGGSTDTIARALGAEAAGEARPELHRRQQGRRHRHHRRRPGQARAAPTATRCSSRRSARS